MWANPIQKDKPLELSVSGFATVFRGTTEDVTFTSNPSGAKMTTSTGLFCRETPCTFKVERRPDFIATYRKLGFQEQQIQVTSNVGPNGIAAGAGNVLIGGVIGLAVDAGTGANFEHHPNPVHAESVTARPAKATPLSAHRKKPTAGPLAPTS